MKGHLISYCDSKNGFRVFFPQTNARVSSREVIFDTEQPRSFHSAVSEKFKVHMSNTIDKLDDENFVVENAAPFAIQVRHKVSAMT